MYMYMYYYINIHDSCKKNYNYVGARNRGATSRVIPRDGGVNVGPKLPPGAVRVLPAGAGDSGTGRRGQSGARGGGGGRGRGGGRGGGGGGKGRGQGYEGGGEKEEADDSSSWDSRSV